jgi:predicted RNase H-like nuclease
MEVGSEAVLGVDGCRGGWIGALVRGRSVEWLKLGDAAAILAADAAVIAIDIPIGLSEPGPGFRRGADLEAREFLRPWSASNAVFLTPIRQVLSVDTYAEANALSSQLTGKGLAKQTWNITDRIAAVDEALGDPPDSRVIEVHPEVSFRLLDKGIGTSKRTARGVGQRISALSSCFDMTCTLGDVPAGPGLDDCLDACAAAWSAQRWQLGTARVFGLAKNGRAPTDARDRPMRIIG